MVDKDNRIQREANMVEYLKKELTVGKAIGFYFLSFILLFVVELSVNLILEMIGLGANAIYFPSDQIVCIALALLVLRKYGYSENEIFSTPTKVNLPLWFLIVVSTISLIPIVDVIYSCVIKIFPMPQFWVELQKHIIQEYFKPHSFLDYLRLIILGGVLTGLSEEFFHRGFLQTVFCQRLGNTKGVILASLLFVIPHVIPWSFPHIFLMGLFLGFLYLRTGTLWASIFAHSLNNIICFFGLFFDKNSDPNHAFPVYISLPALMIFCLSIYSIFVLTKKSAPKAAIPNMA